MITWLGLNGSSDTGSVSTFIKDAILRTYISKKFQSLSKSLAATIITNRLDN